MNCEEYKILVNSFVDESLETDEQVKLFKHLSECNECRSFLDSMVKFRNYARSENLVPPPELDDEIFSEISHRKLVYNKSAKKERKSFWDWNFTIRAPLAAAIIILLIICGVLLINNMNRKYEMFEAQQAQQASYMNDPSLRPVKYIIVTEMPEIEIIGSQNYPKKAIRRVQSSPDL
jgi:hypothetical protein